MKISVIGICVLFLLSFNVASCKSITSSGNPSPPEVSVNKQPFDFYAYVFNLCYDYINSTYFPSAQIKKNSGSETSLKSSPVKICFDSVPKYFETVKIPLICSKTEQSIINAGLVDIKSIDSSIVVNLKYSTTDNFMGINMYGGFNKCYLQKDVAEKLKKAQFLLKLKFPYYSLIVFDAARPRSIQQKMWSTVDIPYNERTKFLSNPKEGSLHNFGAAVDVGFIDEHGIVLDMGTPYDYFGELAYPSVENQMIKEGKLSHKQSLSRGLLRDVMNRAGFSGITTEWWHFNSCSLNTAYSKYSIIE